MRFGIHTLAAAALAVSSVSASAGGIAPEVIETPAVIVDAPSPAGSSADPAFIILGILAALLIASAASDNDGPTMQSE